MRLALGVFLIFHGLVHAMYIGQALRWFELKPGMKWPEGSWNLSSWMSEHAVRVFVVAVLGDAALALVVGGAAYIAGAGWAPWVVIAGAALASFAHILLWSGKWAQFAEEGGIGVLINVAAIAAILMIRS